jgi:hypothetical protein
MKNAMKAAKINELIIPKLPENGPEEIAKDKIEMASGELSPIDSNFVERRSEKKSILMVMRNKRLEWPVRTDKVQNEEQGPGRRGSREERRPPQVG